MNAGVEHTAEGRHQDRPPWMDVSRGSVISRPRETTSPANRALSMAPWRMRKVLRHIEGHLHRRIRVSELAELAGLSASHFSRAFRDDLNATPKSFIRRNQIERAKALMAGSDCSLAQIAQECGFSDQAHFTRAFRDLVGLPPSCWRRRIHAEQTAWINGL
jgi:AraC-like DNA-binding protein